MKFLKCLTACFRGSSTDDAVTSPRPNRRQSGTVHATSVRVEEEVMDVTGFTKARDDLSISSISLDQMDIKNVEESKKVSPTSALMVMMAGTNMYAHFSNDHSVRVEQYMNQLPDLDGVCEPFRDWVENNPSQILCQEAEIYGNSVAFWRKSVVYRRLHTMLMQNPEYKQVLLVADGINPMVAALSDAFPDVQFYCTDIDPSVVQTRQEIFRTLDLIKPRNNVTCLVHDARHPETLRQALEAVGCQTDKPIYATTEGLVFFMPRENEMALYDAIFEMNEDNIVLTNIFNSNQMYSDQGRCHQVLDKMVTESMNLETPNLRYEPLSLYMTSDKFTADNLASARGLGYIHVYEDDVERGVDSAIVNSQDKVMTVLELKKRKN